MPTVKCCRESPDVLPGKKRGREGKHYELQFDSARQTHASTLVRRHTKKILGYSQSFTPRGKDTDANIQGRKSIDGCPMSQKLATSGRNGNGQSFLE